MSNEEIVIRIQAGEKDLVADLWEQIEKLVAWKARRVASVLDGKGGVTFDDLYNSGFLAMVAAVDTYKPDGGTFAAWLTYYLKTAFSEATGIRTQRDKNDPLRNAVSLSSPVGDDDDAAELADFIPDPNGKRAMESVEEQIWYEQLRQAMDDVLGELPEEQSSVLRHRYYEGKTRVTVGQEMGIPAEEVHKLEYMGIRELRRPKTAKKIRPFYDFDYYAGTGLQTFRHTGMSIQERCLIRKEGKKE